MRADRTICKIKSDAYAIGIWWQFLLNKNLDAHGYLLYIYIQQIWTNL